MIPNQLFEKSQLSIIERYLYSVLIKYCGAKDFCFPSRETLANDMGVSVRYISDLLKVLEEQGFIRRTRRGWNRSNTYEVAKQLVTDRNSSAYLLRNMLPFQQSTVVPPKNTYLNKKTKKSRKGLENMREAMTNLGISRQYLLAVSNPKQ